MFESWIWAKCLFFWENQTQAYEQFSLEVQLCVHVCVVCVCECDGTAEPDHNLLNNAARKIYIPTP
jgi:hypothetical protein